MRVYSKLYAPRQYSCFESLLYNKWWDSEVSCMLFSEIVTIQAPFAVFQPARHSVQYVCLDVQYACHIIEPSSADKSHADTLVLLLITTKHLLRKWSELFAAFPNSNNSTGSNSAHESHPDISDASYHYHITNDERERLPSRSSSSAQITWQHDNPFAAALNMPMLVSSMPATV